MVDELRWRDVDWERGQLHIERGLHQLADGTLDVQAPKTRAARRTVAIGPAVLIGLRGHRERIEADNEILCRTIGG